MLIQHLNEQAQVHRYNCSNLRLQVSAVVFFAGCFATRLGGTCVAKSDFYPYEAERPCAGQNCNSNQ